MAGQSAPQPMSSSSPRPFETGLMNKTSSPKLNMPKLGERYIFCDHIILQLNYTKFPITACLCNYLNLFPITACLQLINIQNVKFFSVDIPWGKLAEHVETYQREIIALPGNGYCLINSIIKCMTTNFNQKIKQQDLLDQIVNELYENAEQYAPFYQDTKKQMIKKAELYAQDASKIYTDEIVDVTVCATANVIGYNLAIFQNLVDRP